MSQALSSAMNPLNKLLLFICLLLLSFSLGFGYLSYQLYADNKLAEKEISSLVEANTSIERMLETERISRQIEDLVVSEDSKTRDVLSEVQHKGVEKIVELERLEATKQENVRHERDEALLSDKLPAELVDSLHNTFYSLQRESGSGSAAE